MSPSPKTVNPRETISPTASLPLRVEHENLDEKIYNKLKASIAERRLLPGERILQDHVAREMGVSRTPLVNALKRLAQEGLVEWVMRRGIYVKRFSKRQMVQLYEVREVLEGLSTRLAAPRIDRVEVDRLVKMFRDLHVTPTQAAVRDYIERDRYLHWRLVEIAGNAQLTKALESVNMMLFTWQDGLVRPAAETIQEHYVILEALRRHDAVASEAAMRLHIRRSVDRLEQEAEAEEKRTKEAPERRW